MFHSIILHYMLFLYAAVSTPHRTLPPSTTSWLFTKSHSINFRKSNTLSYSHWALNPISIRSLSSKSLTQQSTEYSPSSTLAYPSHMHNLSWTLTSSTLKRKQRKYLDSSTDNSTHTACSTHTLLTLYKIMVRTILEYGSVICYPPFP